MATFLSPDKYLFSPTDEDVKEIFRYLGYKKLDCPDLITSQLVDECSKEMFAVIAPKAIFDTFDLNIQNEIITLANISFSSHDLSINLKNCSEVALLATTIGPLVDNMIHRYEKIDTVKAAIMQATGAMYIEKLVDYTNNEICQLAKNQNKICKPRYSPGFGDVPLSIQKDFFNLLPCSKIGLTLMDTLIMAPEKSVTAFVGIQ